VLLLRFRRVALVVVAREGAPPVSDVVVLLLVHAVEVVM